MSTKMGWSACLANSSRFRTFAMVFGIVTAALYVISDMAKLPLFTYYPATGRIDFGWTPSLPEEGPAMYWYGWIATSVVGAALLGFVAAMLPNKLSAKIPLSLTWLIPLLLTPVLIYSLKFYWRW